MSWSRKAGADGPAESGFQPSAGLVTAGWVVDASVTMQCFSRTRPHRSPRACLPTLWVLECTNVLQSAQRRRRIDAARRAEIASELSALPVRIDVEVPEFVSLDRLAATHGLTAYDAAYLELALRRSWVLVSLDARLVAAAQSMGHPTLSQPSGAGR